MVNVTSKLTMLYNWGERVSAVELLAFGEDEAFYN